MSYLRAIQDVADILGEVVDTARDIEEGDPPTAADTIDLQDQLLEMQLKLGGAQKARKAGELSTDELERLAAAEALLPAAEEATTRITEYWEEQRRRGPIEMPPGWPRGRS